MIDVFPERLKLSRLSINATQMEFASMIGISRASLSYYENAEREPNIDILPRIAEVTGCSVLWLLGMECDGVRVEPFYPDLSKYTDTLRAMADAIDQTTHRTES